MTAIHDQLDLRQIDRSDWKTYRFSQITRSISERIEPQQTDLTTYVGLEHIDAESIHIKRFGKPSDVEGTKLRVYPGDVIFGKRRAYQRKAATATFDGICSAHAMVLRANPSVIEPCLFPFFLHSDLFMHRAIDISVGSLSPTINWGTLKDQEFLLPPLDQQAKLAELLWAADEVVEATNNAFAKYTNLKHDLREQLIFKGLDKTKSYKKTVLGSTPIDWQVLPFSEAIEIVSGQVDPKEEQYATLIQIGPEHIEPGTGRILAWQTSRELGLTSGKYLFSKEHVLYSKIRPYFKKVANPDCVGLCSADVYALKSVDGLVDKKFLFHYLLTDKFTTALLAFQNRTGMPKVNREELGNMHIPIPPADQQEDIRAVLDDIDEKVEQFINTLNSSKLALNALINQLFSPESVVVTEKVEMNASII